MMDGTKGLVKVGCCPRALDMSVPYCCSHTNARLHLHGHCRLMGEAVEHIPQSVPPSFSPLLPDPKYSVI